VVAPAFTEGIGGWLRGLGLGQYQAAFRENKIDGEVLPQLTAEDLKDIGVAIVDDRREMLTAIADGRPDRQRAEAR